MVAPEESRHENRRRMGHERSCHWYLTLALLAAGTGTGMVVTVHANGPKVYAVDRYQLRHADPGANYQVLLHLYLGQADCSGSPGATLPVGQIETNVAGNGSVQARFTPEDVVGLRGLSFPIDWTVTQDGVTTHETSCTIVTLD